ncbi:hypothetical protein ACOSP7_020317 [Xanthoceras sorbifolium]
MAACNSIRSVLVTLLIFAMVFSPILPCQAVRFTAIHDNLSHIQNFIFYANWVRLILMRIKKPPTFYCLQCVCCAPAPPGQCCKCHC